MKQIYSFLVLAVALLFSIGVANAQQTLPYSYGFENNDLSADGWTTQNPSGLNASEFGIYSAAAQRGDYGFRFSSYDDRGESTQYLISPELNAPTGVVVQFSYKVSSSNSAGETFKVGYSTTDANISSFTFGSEISAKNTSWTLSEEFTFPANTKYVAIYYYPDWQYRLYIDDFTFEAYSSCAKPADLTVDYTEGETTATISWTSSAPSFNFDVNGVITTVTGNSTTISVVPLTEYTINVQADCGDEQSNWVSTSFNGGCPATFAIPYSYGFEDLTEASCWTKLPSNNMVVDTQDSVYAHSGDNFFLITYTTTPPQYLISPELSGIANGLHVEFYYSQYVQGVETFQVGYSTTDNDPESFTWGDEITASTSYQRFSANYPAATKYVAVKYTSDNQYYLFLDDFLFEESASCLEPTAVNDSAVTTTTATVFWHAGASETEWDVYVTDDTDEPDETTTPTETNTSDNPYDLQDLTPATTYYVYVRAHCGASETSAWSSPAIFQTECEAKSLPYQYDFESDQFEYCWKTINTNTSYNSARRMGLGSGTVLSLYMGSSTGDLAAILPEFDATYSLNGYQVSFDACYANSSSTSMTYGKLGVGIMTDPNDLSTFELIEEVDINDGYNTEDSQLGLRSHTVWLNSYTGNGHYIALQNIHTQNGYVLIDNISVTELPACLSATDLHANVTDTSVVLSWKANNGESEWTLYWKETAAEDYTEVAGLTDTTYTLRSLLSNTDYQFYVVAHCSETEMSDPSGVYGFTTPCGVITVDAAHAFTEDFEGDVFPPACWSTIESGTHDWSEDFSYYHTESGTTSAHSGYYGTIYLLSPELAIANDNLDYTDVKFTFWSFYRFMDDFNGRNSIVLLNGDEETELWAVDETSVSEYEWIEDTIDLTAYKGQTIRLAFKYEGDNANSWYVDDVEVAFYTPSYDITVAANPMEGGNVAGEGTFEHGTVDTLVATPNEGYTFVNWTKDGEVVSTAATYPLMVEGPGAYVANFDTIRCAITVTANPTVGGEVTGEGTYNYGTSVELTATPHSGYTFTNWTKDGEVVSTEASYTFTATESGAYVANFTGIDYIITYMNDTVVLDMDTFACGDAIIPIADPTWEGHTFTGWEPALPNTMPDSNMTVYAQWQINTYTVNVTVSEATPWGTVTGSGRFDHGTVDTMTATPNEGYVFIDWSDFNTDTLRLITVTQDSNFTAYFMPEEIVIPVNDTVMGEVDIDIPDTVNHTTMVTLTAIPEPHYHFVCWSDSVTTNPRTVTILEALHLSAIFAIDQHTITVRSADESMGTTSIGGTYDYGTEITISADALQGYVFVTWQDSVTTNPRTVVVTQDSNFVAYFQIEDGINEVNISNVNIYSYENQIVVANAEGCSVEIFDMTGRLVVGESSIAQSERRYTLSVSGIYLVKVGDSVVKKVTVLSK